MSEREYKVRAVHCDHRADEEKIYQSLVRVTDPLERSWRRLQDARRIVLKFNMMKLPERLFRFEGRRRELVAHQWFADNGYELRRHYAGATACTPLPVRNQAWPYAPA